MKQIYLNILDIPTSSDKRVKSFVSNVEKLDIAMMTVLEVI